MRYDLYAVHCPACTAANKADARQCSGCGAALSSKPVCPNCKFSNPVNAYICLKCYKPLKAKARVGLLHMHVPWGVSVVLISALVGTVAYGVAHGIYQALESHVEESAVMDRYMALQQTEMRQREQKLADEDQP